MTTTRRYEGARVLVMTSGIRPDRFDDIGHAAARAFAQEGADVVLVHANDENAQASSAELQAAGVDVTTRVLDPRDLTSLDELIKDLRSQWGSLDALVTSHFGTVFANAAATTPAQLEDAFRVNVTGPFAATLAVVPLLERAENPTVVHVSSIDGSYGNPNVPAYSISKAGTTVMIHVLAAELAAKGIRVNGIARAASTVMPIPDVAFGSLADATPLVRAADPAEYARPILFLASPESSYITGAVLPTDGGRTAITPGTSPGYQGYRAYLGTS